MLPRRAVAHALACGADASAACHSQHAVRLQREMASAAGGGVAPPLPLGAGGSAVGVLHVAAASCQPAVLELLLQVRLQMHAATLTLLASLLTQLPSLCWAWLSYSIMACAAPRQAGLMLCMLSSP